jgi:hypothetical protein
VIRVGFGAVGASAFGWALLGWGVLGCDLNKGLRDQQANAHICWLEDRLRNAANPEKATFLAELASAPCPSRDACDTREQCIGAYTLHVDGLKLTQAAKLQMQDGRGDEAARLLGSAEAKLGQARDKVSRCTELAAALRKSNGGQR